jgi:hypothetical protein
MKIKESANYLFNWRKNPLSVFFTVAPLAIIGFGSLFLLAILKFKFSGDPWYLVIFAIGMVLFAFALWPIRKQLFGLLVEKPN